MVANYVVKHYKKKVDVQSGELVWMINTNNKPSVKIYKIIHFYAKMACIIIIQINVSNILIKMMSP